MKKFPKYAFSEWMKSGKYLPPVMRDFHDQKDIFKAIHQVSSDHQGTKNISWIDAHIYVIDIFLYFMAKRGYTLQKSRMIFEFDDLELDVHAAKSIRDSQFLSKQNNTN